MSVVTRVEVEADLHLEVVGADGSRASARLTGDGQRLHLELDHPEVMGTGAGRSELGRAARLLADAGLTVEVTGPSGPIAAVGAGIRSRLGRLLVGSDRVAMARSGHAGRIVWTLVPPAVRRGVPAGGLVLLLGVLVRLRIRTVARAQSGPR